MASQEKPVFPLPVWFLLEALCILAYTVKPSPYRWAFFIPIASLAFWGLACTRASLDNNMASEIGVGCRLVTALFFASTDILFTDPQRELRLIGQKTNVAEAPFLSRLWWGVTLWGNPRGINYAHEPTANIPPRPTQKTRFAFVIAQLCSIAFHILIYDLNGMMNRANPYLSKDQVLVTGYQQLWRLAVFGHLVMLHIMLTVEYKIISILSVLLGITTPQDWPNLFNSPFEGYTVRRFWGTNWHQMFRRIFTTHTNFFTSKLRLPPKSKFTTYFKLYIAFFMSALLHYGGDAFGMQSLTKPHSIKGFMLQAVAITFEDAFLGLARMAGFTRANWATKLVGYVWVLAWFGYSLPFWLGPAYAAGYGDKLQYSVVLGLWRGEWVPKA